MTVTRDNRDELGALRRRVEVLETRESERVAARTRVHSGRRRLARLLALGAVVAIFVAAAASAAPSAKIDCPGGELFCFNPNTPAVFSEVNHNFAQLQAWLEEKVGTAGNPEVRIQTGTTDSTAAAAGKPLFVSGDIGANSNGIEFMHDNLTAGIGFGWNTIYATGTNADGNIHIQSKGNGRIYIDDRMDVGTDMYVNGRVFGGISIGGEVQAERLGAGTSTVLLGAANGRRACFLTYRYDWNGDFGGSTMLYNTCSITESGGNWYVNAVTNAAGGSWNNTRCKARCITW